MSLFAIDSYFHYKKPKISTQTLKLINEFSRIAGYEINGPICCVSVY